ncbi:hypothetical protein SASPL_102769 [Salvia splendens]|uniref:Uncharacterized protein n=1 Tax=Salvia splendens TaxID=180675 RepID=A0A8X8YT83_SALSN|nr:hypothetical protein SASPL_102769 [Salvia splendens]
MRCKKHPADQSCSVGVCASCLRERLVAVIAAQTQAHALKHALQDCRKSDSQLPQPPLFPRSVSPYISRRKSENAPAAATSKPERKPDFGLDPVADPTVSVNSSSASPAWFPNIIRGRRKKKVSTFLIDESAFRTGNNRGRGMSPARNADQFDEHCDGVTSGYSSDSKGWRQTPRRTQTSARRGGGRAASHGRSLSSLTFCLSPLVRPSPNRHWNQKAAPPEAGDPRTTPKAHLSTAVSFCKNRSRKLADIGRYPNG